MPETSEARGRAGGGLAPQEGLALDIFQSYPQVELFFKDLSCFLRSFLFLAPLEALVLKGYSV